MPSSIWRFAAPWLPILSVTITRGAHVQPFRSLRKNFLAGFFVVPTLRGNIQGIPHLLHDPPGIGAFAVDGEQHLIRVPLVARSRTPATQLMGKSGQCHLLLRYPWADIRTFAQMPITSKPGKRALE